MLKDVSAQTNVKQRVLVDGNCEWRTDAWSECAGAGVCCRDDVSAGCRESYPVECSSSCQVREQNTHRIAAWIQCSQIREAVVVEIRNYGGDDGRCCYWCGGSREGAVTLTEEYDSRESVVDQLCDHKIVDPIAIEVRDCKPFQVEDGWRRRQAKVAIALP